jgi:hypothetical protein
MLFIEILRHTPVWVWGVFAVLLVFGLMQMRRRSVALPLVFVLPVIMIPLSLFTVAYTFGIQPFPLIAWVAGVALAFALNAYLFRAPSGVRYMGDTNKFDVPGSLVPLILMMTIFLARFVLGVMRALNPALVASDPFAGIVSVTLGVCSGLFAARAMKTLSARATA